MPIEEIYPHQLAKLREYNFFGEGGNFFDNFFFFSNSLQPRGGGSHERDGEGRRIRTKRPYYAVLANFGSFLVPRSVLATFSSNLKK